MHLDPFELHFPTTVEEAVAIAHDHAGETDWLAGGTDLLPNYKMHLNAKPHLIALERVTELTERRQRKWGAMVRLADLERDAAWASEFPGVASAVAEVATPLVRASGTVGGNLLLDTRCFFFNQSYFWRASLGFCLKAEGSTCHVVPQNSRCYATFSGDLAPPLLALGARVEVAGDSGRRTVPLADLYDAAGDGIHRHALAPGELLVSVDLPETAPGTPAEYLKLRIRPSFDFPELGVAVAGRFEDGRVRELALAAGGLETYPRRFDELTSGLAGSPLTDETIRELGERVQTKVRPVHNTFLAPDYRRKMTGVYVRRALTAWRARCAS